MGRTVTSNPGDTFLLPEGDYIFEIQPTMEIKDGDNDSLKVPLVSLSGPALSKCTVFISYADNALWKMSQFLFGAGVAAGENVDIDDVRGLNARLGMKLIGATNTHREYKGAKQNEFRFHQPDADEVKRLGPRGNGQQAAPQRTAQSNAPAGQWGAQPQQAAPQAAPQAAQQAPAPKAQMPDDKW